MSWSCGLPRPLGDSFAKFHVRVSVTRPSLPERTISAAFWKCSPERCCVPICETRLYRRAALTIVRPSMMLCEIGFSQYTSLPAMQAVMNGMACQWSGVPTITASMSLLSVISRKSLVVAGRLPRVFST